MAADASQWWAITTAIIAGILLIASLISAVKKGMEPIRTIEARVDALEQTDERIMKMLDNDKSRMDGIEDGLRAQSKMLLAVGSHLMDGNHTEQIAEAAAGLQEYLINR